MTVRVGLIGLGAIARTHVAALRSLTQEGVAVEIAGYVGRPDAAAALGLPGAPATLAELLARPDIDLIADASPSAVHAEHAVAALDAGKGVVVEKPLATTGADAERVLAAAERHGGFGSVFAQRRFEVTHQYVHRLLSQGRLGAVVAASVTLPWWRDDAYFAAAPWRGRAPEGGVLLNQGIHSVDLLLWLLGDAVAAVGFGTSAFRPGDAVDTCAGAVRFANGALATVLATSAAPPGSPATLSIHTTAGTVSLSQSETTAWTFDVPPPPASSGGGMGASDPGGIGHAGHAAQWRDIIEAYQQGRSPAVPLRDGLRAVALCEALVAGRHPDSVPPGILG